MVKDLASEVDEAAAAFEVAHAKFVESGKLPSPAGSCSTSVRQRRLAHALLKGAVSREEADQITGGSNSPDVVLRLRGAGVPVRMSRVPAQDRDGRTVFPGVYFIRADERHQAHSWLSRSYAAGRELKRRPSASDVVAVIQCAVAREPEWDGWARALLHCYGATSAQSLSAHRRADFISHFLARCYPRPVERCFRALVRAEDALDRATAMAATSAAHAPALSHEEAIAA